MSPRRGPRRTGSLPAPSRAPREWALLAVVLALGAALRVGIMFHASGLTMDSPLYVEMAARMGRVLPPLGPAHHGYPALVSLASLLIPGREMPGRLVSLLAGLTLIAVTYLLARRALPARGALVAATLVALHPLLALSSGLVMTEASFQALAYIALLALHTGPMAIAGALLGLAYWIRPEALVMAAAAGLVPVAARRRAILVGAFALGALPEVAWLSAERGHFTLTPKTNLVEASGAARDDAEWRASAADSTATRAPIGQALAAMAARYPDRLAGQLQRLHQTWPAPLLALSVVGAVVRPGPLLVPLAILPVLPLLGVTPHLRYPQTLVPALAVYAAIGAAWGVARAASRARAALAGLALLLGGGLLWCWWGPAGEAVRHPEDAPIPSLRTAGRWLAVHGRADALVMDRKPYVPFFAGMRHALMPDDDYDAIVTHAQRTGVDYLVIEEHVMWSMRQQFVPLMTDSAFRARERRLQMVFGGDQGPMTGVAIFEVRGGP